ncbi:MAG: pilin [Candidatus Komeilibacteria bacterium]
MIKKIIILIALLLPLVGQAAILDNPELFPPNNSSHTTCIEDGSCTLDQGFGAFVALGQWGLGVVGAAALLMFIYGGFQWLTAAGNPSKIESGKKTLVASLTGVIIVLLSWLIVQSIYQPLTGNNLTGAGAVNQADICLSAADGTDCRGGLGQCQNGECVQKCDLLNDPSYACRESVYCDTDYEIPGQCFGASNILCCKEYQAPALETKDLNNYNINPVNDCTNVYGQEYGCYEPYLCWEGTEKSGGHCINDLVCCVLGE